MSGHTKGPWIVVRRNHRLMVRGGGCTTWPIGSSDVCTWAERRRGARRGETPAWMGFDAETEANARLIAAAPELLEACKAALTEMAAWEMDPDDMLNTALEPIRSLRAAIAKAEGV